MAQISMSRSEETGRMAKAEPGTEVQFANERLVLPAGYNPVLSLRETEQAIKFVKDGFEHRLATALNLQRVSAPLTVLSGTGVNDHLNEVEQPIVFNVKGVGKPAEIVQSLAKWKRLALADYGFAHGEGLYTDMNAIRPDETLDNLHSLYVDQWDWERVIRKDERSVEFLKGIVRSIYAAVRDMEREVCAQYPGLAKPYLPEDIFFIHSQDLEDRYPGLSPKERENAICREKGAVFVMGIGHPLKSGSAHDGRAADYDDWVTETSAGRGLNGDIVVWYPVLGCAFELSSMGIRVDKEALLRQLELTGTTDKKELYFHRRVLNGEAPLSIGGGIGQSRLCMLFLRKAHIGEVQAGVWHNDTLALCRAHGIPLL